MLPNMGFNLGLDKLNLVIEEKCKDVAPWKIIGVTAVTTYSIMWIQDFLSDEELSVTERAKRYAFSWIRAIPMVKRKVEEESISIRKSIENDMNKDLANCEVYYQLPKGGRSAEEVFAEANAYFMLGNSEWKKGSISGAVYNYNTEANKLYTDVFSLSALTNPLHPDVFPGIRKMEAEVIQMCIDMFHGGPNACGAMSSGGTESILLACKAYRDYARRVKGIRFPEIVAPTSAHAAFVKAAQVFRMRLVLVPVDPKTYKVDMKAMKKAINRKTCMLVGSAPGFPHGVMDPIVEIAALGKKYDIPVHVDACLGGFIIPFMEEAGYPLPLFDFRVDGVTSISLDSHKYGYAPKGTSIILYSDPLYRKYQFFFATEWSGGIYASPTFAGSRAGALVATCWAAMMYYGRSGYVEATKKIAETQRYIEHEYTTINFQFYYQLNL
uniref:sphinganine-1-phosphate aldolase n=1 Tax=Evadne anonyx TaxID=141404 RepID=A0A9N6WXK8_9CRUS|nr:EOG090X051L [Evadne anonyx]